MEGNHAFKMVDGDGLAGALSSSCMQCRKCADEPVQASLIVGIGFRVYERFPVTFAVQEELASEGFIGESIAAVVGIGPGRVEGRDPDTNQVFKTLLGYFWAEGSQGDLSEGVSEDLWNVWAVYWGIP